MIASFHPFPALTTERLVLRELEPGDIDEIFFLRSDKTVLQYIDREPALSHEEAQMWMRKVGNLLQKNEGINWAMVPKGQTKLIGVICFWNLIKEQDKAETGYSMHPDYFGQGYMNEALRAILHYGFDTMQLKIVEAITDTENTRSRRLLERNGFTRDALLEQQKLGKEEPLDAVIYSIRK